MPDADILPSDAILERLFRLHPKKIDLSLGRLYRLLEKLGDPQKNLPPVIQVAGTNGKGSVVATCRAILEAAGYRVHVYTSPHLVRFAERIRVAGKLIGEEMLSSLLEECETANGSEPITYFEITTAAALLAFSRTSADACILEVGLGGRFDATNVIDEPLITAITPISQDHTEFLGTTPAKIACEKAGIMKPGVPCVLGSQSSAVDKVLREKATSLSAPVIACPDDWQMARSGKKQMAYRDRYGLLKLPLPVLAGRHQMLNAGHAIAVLRHQTVLSVSEAAIRAGLGWVRWPARLQPIQDGPLFTALPSGASLWLDGGHNAAAARALRDYFRNHIADDQPLYLIVGMIKSKDVAGFLKPLTSLARAVYAVAIPGQENAHPPAHIAAAASDAGLTGLMAKDVQSAIKAIAARNDNGPAPIILIAGSLYLAGEVLRRSAIRVD